MYRMEVIANIFFYTKNGITIMIDAGYNYERLREKMEWLDIEPSEIQHILITHQDTDHVGAVERDSDGLFRDATLYIGEVENRYLTKEVRRKVYGGRSFLNALAEDNELSVKSLAALKELLQKRNLHPMIITGHTGWSDDMDFVFAHTDLVCNASRKQKPHDPNAPYDGYDESDDTREKARTVRLEKAMPVKISKKNGM